MTGVIVPKPTGGGPARRRVRIAALAAPCAWSIASTLAGTLATAVACADPGHVERFPVTNRAPFTALLGLPTGGIGGGEALELSWDIASHAVGAQAGGESLLLDGETHAVTLRWQRPLGPRLAVGLELPWVAHGGGFLDRPIDGWHDVFGLSEGIRPELPTGDLRYAWSDGERTLDVTDATSGIGDLRTAASLRVAGSGRGEPGWGLDLTADVEWATGDADHLTGSGGTDIAAGLRVESPRPPGGRVGWSAGAGVAWPGDVDLPLPPAAGHILYFDATLAWAAWPSLDLLLQVQGHDAPFDSALDVLGDPALQLGGGLAWRFGDGFSLRFGVFEDLVTDTSPDFATHLALTWRR